MRKVYFGNANKQVWIPAPQSGMQAESGTRLIENQLLSGRMSITRSGANSRRFTASWIGGLNEPGIEDSLHTIKDFYDGVYGDGPFYWNDPYASGTNLLPPHWAAPALSRNDWPQIASFEPTEYLATATNTLNYPTFSARYNITTTTEVSSTRKLTLIIPPDYNLHFGWHGVVTSGLAKMRITRYARSNGAASNVDADVISVTSNNRTNVSINGDTYSRVEIYLYKPNGAASDIRISGMIAQILPDGTSPATGDFLGGRGTSALEFAAPVALEYYSANVNNGQVGLSTQWQEV